MNRRYLIILSATMLTTFVAVWVWIAAMPMAYLDPEYPAWLAKEQMLADCDLGELMVVGDSRAAVDIMPGILPVKTTNLAVGGGSPIEAYVAVARALTCADRPQRVIVSLGAAHFTEPDMFWERTVRFGFLGGDDLADLLRVSRWLGDQTYYDLRQADGLPGPVRAALYAVRLPSLYFNSLVKGGVFLRWWHNKAALAAGIAARGQYFFGTDDGSSIVAVDAQLADFTPLPVLAHYFDRMLAQLAEFGIAVDFIAMPMNQATWLAVRPEVRAGFTAYLDRYAVRYPNFRVVGEIMPHWPDRWFGDGYAHLNPAGARRFSEELAKWLASDRRPPLAAARSTAENAEGGTERMVQ
jgi:hypothetical protein